MEIKRAHLYNYRNYKQEFFDFASGLNLIVGDNAQGKTNLLESIYFSSIGKSFRSNKLSDVIGPFSEFLQIGLLFFDDSDIEFKFTSDGVNKKYILDGSEIKDRSELFGMFPMALFFPDYLDMIKDTPSYRRSFINREISLYSKNYLHALIAYNKYLSEKNCILKQEKIDLRMLDVYDKELSRFGVIIAEYRKEFIEFLSERAKKIHSEFTSGKEELDVKYKSFYDGELDEKIFFDMVKDSFERDIKKGYSQVGVHLDDIYFEINGKEVKKFGSQGQVRIASISVFFALIEYIETKTDIRPIVLLDDAFSELDATRQNKIIEYTRQYQTIITATNVNFLNEKHLVDANVIEIEAGRARRNN